MTEETKDKATDALEGAIEEASEERATEAAAEARADERQSSLEARLAALEQSRTDAPAFDPSSITDAMQSALAPITERLGRLETPPEKPPEKPPEPEKQEDAFAPQIDLAAIGRGAAERMPKVTHTLFKRWGR